MKQFVFNVMLLPLVLSSLCGPASAQTLEGFASLPADTFEPGPTSGQFIAATNGRTPPFVNRQPVQGVSSVLRAANGDYLVMSDNGFGSKESSPDYVLRVHRISPDFKTKTGGTGTIAVKSFITLSDPDKMIDFPIVADMATYPGGTIAVDLAIRNRRLLTGWDFDIESMREAHDGTLWFGDEFGPFLIHTDATGRVLGPPIELPGVRSPQNPFLGSSAFTIPRSKGFEGMAISPDGKTLYPMLEGAITTDVDQRRLLIKEFDVRSEMYTGREWWYRLSSTSNAIGDLTAVSADSFLVIERDNGEGPAAVFKKIYLVHFDELDAAGYLVKEEVVDLMAIANRTGWVVRVRSSPSRSRRSRA